MVIGTGPAPFRTKKFSQKGPKIDQNHQNFSNPEHFWKKNFLKTIIFLLILALEHFFTAQKAKMLQPK